MTELQLFKTTFKAISLKLPSSLIYCLRLTSHAHVTRQTHYTLPGTAHIIVTNRLIYANARKFK